MAKTYGWFSAVSRITLPDDKVGYEQFKSPLPLPGFTVEQVIAELLQDGVDPDELKKAIFGHVDLHYRAKAANRIRASLAAAKDGKVTMSLAWNCISQAMAKAMEAEDTDLSAELQQIVAKGPDAVKAYAGKHLDRTVDVSNLLTEAEAKPIDIAWKEAKRKALGTVEEDEE